MFGCAGSSLDISLVAVRRDSSLAVVHRLLIVVASLMAEHRLSAHGLQLWCMVSVVV